MQEALAHADRFIEAHCDAIRKRIISGDRMLREFEAAYKAFKGGKAPYSALRERINEIAFAHRLFTTQFPEAEITYEFPLQSGKEIDFQIRGAGYDALIEFKSVHPESENHERSWNRFERLQPRLRGEMIFEKDKLGGEIAANTFAAREKILEHTLDLESALDPDESRHVCLVFGINSQKWCYTILEDFDEFYRSGVHRADDHLADLELHYLDDRNRSLRRSISSLIWFERRTDAIFESKCFVPSPPPLPWNS